MIEHFIVRQHPDEATRTSSKSCRWIAEAVVGSQTYTAHSRFGAPHEMARLLVAAGVLDMPVRVETAGLRGFMTYRSLHAMAGVTCEEAAATPLHRVRWEDPALRRARIDAAFREKPASTPSAVGEEGSALPGP